MSQLSEQMDFSKIQPRLSAPLARLRKQCLGAVKDLAPQSALAVLRERFAQETDGAMRLGNIAAQSWIIRQRLISLQTEIHGQQAQPPHSDVADEAPAVTTANTGNSAPEALAETVEAQTAAAPEWIKLRILTETEVNGMRFFAGSTIEVRSDDARKLIAAKSAEVAEVDNTAHSARVPESKAKSAKKK